MYFQPTLRLTSILLSCFIALNNPSYASDLDSNDEKSDNHYMAGNRWGKGIQETEAILDSLEDLRLTDEESYRQEIEGYFFYYLSWYKSLDFSAAPDKKLEMATKLRTYETKLSPYYNGIQFNPEDLWDGDVELEYVEIRSMTDLKAAISRGAPTPPADLIELILNGGSTSFPLNHHVPPKFFKLPSNFSGQRFLVGGEREQVDQQSQDYMLNFNSKFHPDILADASNPASYVCIPDNKFSIVEFDFVDNRILLNIPVLQECARILSVSGTFIFRTQRDTLDYYNRIAMDILTSRKKLMDIFSDVNAELKTDENWESKTHNRYWLFTAKKS